MQEARPLSSCRLAGCASLLSPVTPELAQCPSARPCISRPYTLLPHLLDAPSPGHAVQAIADTAGTDRAAGVLHVLGSYQGTRENGNGELILAVYTNSAALDRARGRCKGLMLALQT